MCDSSVSKCSFYADDVGTRISLRRRRRNRECVEWFGCSTLSHWWWWRWVVVIAFRFLVLEAKTMNVLCFRCGDMGHYARDCGLPPSERPARSRGDLLCYRCNQPGHIAAQCEMNQGGGSSSMGTMAVRQQRSGNGSDRRCYNCDKVGHLSRDCPEDQPTQRFASFGRGRPIRCYRCNRNGHFARECEQTEETCYRCNRPGHIAKDCTSTDPAEMPAGRTFRPTNSIMNPGSPVGDAKRACFICRDTSHIARNCPLNDGSGRGGDRNGDISCYNCGGVGHISTQCPESGRNR
ncbi:hypothetical protein ACOME3_009922 [Neoechinorhynchus agilis]